MSARNPHANTTETCYESGGPGGAGNTSPDPDHQPAFMEQGPMTIPNDRPIPPAGHEARKENEPMSWRALNRDMPGVGTVYAIECDGLVKIGFTMGEVTRRRAALQTAHGRELRIVGEIIGTPQMEKMLHRVFARYRVRGEWFNADVRSFFEKMRAMQVSA